MFKLKFNSEKTRETRSKVTDCANTVFGVFSVQSRLHLCMPVKYCVVRLLELLQNAVTPLHNTVLAA